jgi:hypothetical protein
MNHDKEKRLEALNRYNPFWACCIVFLLLAGDYTFRLVNLLAQREQFNQTQLMQAQNMGTLKQAQELERRLETFSLDLLQLSTTNAAAKQIVQQFNIQWTPNAAAAAPGAAPAPVQIPAGTNK